MNSYQKKELVEKQRKFAEENLNCYSAFEGGEKLPTPHSCLELEKQLEEFYSDELNPEEMIKEGKNFLAAMAKTSIDYKEKLAKELYPKLQELFSFFHNEWIVKIYRPEKERINKRCKTIKKQTKDEIEGIHKQDEYEEIESRKLFIKFLNLTSKNKRLDIATIYVDILFLSNTPQWWIFLQTNKLCKEIGNYRDRPSTDVNKRDVLEFYSLASIVRSLYWCTMRIYENLFNLRRATDILSRICEDWEWIKEKFKKKEIDEKEFNCIIEEKYTAAYGGGLNYMIPESIAKIWAAELDMKDELQSSFQLEYLPDKIREKLEKLIVEVDQKNAESEVNQAGDLNCTQLAAELGYNPKVVTLMKAAGFKMPGGRSTLRKAKKWIEDHNFHTTRLGYSIDGKTFRYKGKKKKKT